jgi:hypothetical protein
MYIVLLQMALLIACGALWRVLAPKHIPASSHRRALTDLVFYILLPAMVLDVIWRAPIDLSSLKISVLAMCGLAIGATLMFVVLKSIKAGPKPMGALILAGTFPNATYMGLPVLDQTLGSWSNAVVFQYDLFACTPILLSLGILMAKYFGGDQAAFNPLKELVKVPPLWAVSLAVVLNATGVQQPETMHNFLSILGGGVVPLMLIVLGMSIRWDSMKLRFLPLLLPPIISSLLIIPTAIYWIANGLGLSADYITASVLVAAMPTMVFGVVICERYQLDSEVYAATVTLATICSMVSLPLWYLFLQAG